MTDFMDTVQALNGARAADPEGYKSMVKDQRRSEIVLPRSLRRAYRSKNEGHIKDEIFKAMQKGFTYKEIRTGFLKWKEDQQFIE